ncbi:MAG: pyridoxamine 5'-phosphate oxidase family protein [Gammaproteobacteria bacterium]|nr:pyridoxamine 5'-phosphate oxidase family protein [Gammaproteobacteria bacterium]
MVTVKIPDAAIELLLDRHPVGRLATLGANGKIFQVPIVFVRYEGLLWSPVDGKPKSGGELARVRNVRMNPDMSLLLDAYESDWSKLWWLRIEAKASILQQEPGTDTQVAAVIHALRCKYPQYQDVPVLREPPTLIAIRPTRVLSWCADPRAMLEQSPCSSATSPGSVPIGSPD